MVQCKNNLHPSLYGHNSFADPGIKLKKGFHSIFFDYMKYFSFHMSKPVEMIEFEALFHRLLASIPKSLVTSLITAMKRSKLL
jgi:hypothetical protein